MSLTIHSLCLTATIFLTVSGQDLVTSSGYHGNVYPVGSFDPSPCEICQCSSCGQAYCAIVDCFSVGCVDAVHEPNQCCPVCPNGRNCKAPDGTIIKHGDTYSTAYMTCHCLQFSTLAECAYKPPQPVQPQIV
ncbi:von Willebrand factor C domain-containing protein 2-like [Crassostrea angulata]|uniref:von Willebrand factor C domain-containing protein 2-like n=1 Tax=Magallana angulata TaxID=2784310 RepID=UPI0022B11E08|nr:von Willebrand factor C domain-containing protein 2-like [Crassostrea angulata]